MRRVASLRVVVVATVVVLAAGGAAGALDVTPAGADVNPGATGVNPADVAPATATASADGDVLVVGGDGGYETIQAAVDDATQGDRVVVRPGTYHESVTVDVSVTLVAPAGATLDGDPLEEGVPAIDVVGGAAPTVAGLTVVGYDLGVDARGSTGDWTLRNVTVTGARLSGTDVGRAVDASHSGGDWTVTDSTFRTNGVAVDAGRSTGDWTVANTTFRNNDFGVDASHAEGHWRVADSTFVGHRDGVRAWYAAGDWEVAGSTFRKNRHGIYAGQSSGAWVVRDTVFRNSTYDGLDAKVSSGNWLVEDSVFRDNEFGLSAEGGNGSWRVRDTIFVGSNKTAVWAYGAVVEGDARGNWWGSPEGQDADDCYGNVDCSDHLTEIPLDSPAYREAPDDDPWNRTPVEYIETPTDDPTEVGGDDGGLDVVETVTTAIALGGVPLLLVYVVLRMFRRSDTL